MCTCIKCKVANLNGFSMREKSNVAIDNLDLFVKPRKICFYYIKIFLKNFDRMIKEYFAGHFCSVTKKSRERAW
jgi:hypothetical protein